MIINIFPAMNRSKACMRRRLLGAGRSYRRGLQSVRCSLSSPCACSSGWRTRQRAANTHFGYAGPSFCPHSYVAGLCTGSWPLCRCSRRPRPCGPDRLRCAHSFCGGGTSGERPRNDVGASVRIFSYGLVKHAFHRLRPEAAFYHLGYSFPSGHAMSSVVVYDWRRMCSPARFPPRWRIPIRVIAVAMNLAGRREPGRSRVCITLRT